MRLLFLTNFYPPARPGGYTQWCHEVAAGLQARGHTVGVITSRHELDKVRGPEAAVYRVLHLEGDLVHYQPGQFFRRWRRQRQENLANFRAVLAAFKPDLVFVWGMWAMSPELAALAEALLPGRVVYYLSDYWPASVDMHTAYWTLPARRRFMRLPKRVLGALARSLLAANGTPKPAFAHAVCVSAAVRDRLVEAGIPVERARIIHGGTDTARFRHSGQRDFARRPLRLLYAGQLVPHKGVHTAVEAMARLRQWLGEGCVSLSLVGSGHPQYEAALRGFVRQAGLEAHVAFCGQRPKEAMPEVLREADVLVFPSIYAEPLARMMQEAMLAGLVVVGTTTGGSREILEAGRNGLTFAAEDADGLARQIVRLVEDAGLCARLSEAGRQTVLEKFTLGTMLDKIEAHLLALLPSSVPNSS